MTPRGTLAMLVAGLAVAAGLSAQVANALPNCQTSGTTTTCRTNGSVSIKARPGTTAAPAGQPRQPWYIVAARNPQAFR